MPKVLETKLKKEYGANSNIPYKIMNKMGVMKGNKETAKGKTMDKKSYSGKGTKARLNTAAGKMFFGGSKGSK